MLILQLTTCQVSKNKSLEKKIPVSYENGFLFIHTDKPIYTPDQSVKIRVYSLNEELQPARRDTVLTFVDPGGVEVDILEEKDFTGIVSFPDFKIPPNPKYGIWKIKAKYKKDFVTSAVAEFEVKEYAMPSFSISIEPESNFISSDKFENFRIVVKASYFYNKKLPSADVFLRFGIIEEGEKRMMPQAMHVTRIENGVAVINFDSKNAASSIGFHSLEELDGLYLYIVASVLESTGGLSGEVEFAGVRFAVSPYKLSLVATPLFVKPGLPFFIKVQVKDTGGDMVGNVPITVTAKSLSEQLEETELISEGSESGRRRTSTSDGTALFVVNVPADSKGLEFQVRTADPHLSDENQASKSYEAKAYSSLSQSYLYIDWASNHKVLEVGDVININVYPHSPYIDKIHHYSYLITSKGKIVSFGTQERIKHLEYEHLTFQITQEMVPSARLIVYYIVMGEETAELVADSVWLNVEQKCGNSLEIKLQSSKEPLKPAEVVSLTMKTQASSFVALSSLDKAIYGVTGRRKRPMEKIILHLEKSDLGCGAGGGRNNLDVFRMAGLSFLTNANAEDPNGAVSKYKEPELKKCCMAGVKAYPVSETCSDRAQRIKKSQKCISAFKDCCEFANRLRQEEPNKLLILARMHSEGLLDEAQVRSYFPESWLWEVHQVSSRSKTLSVTLPDSLTTWEVQGVGISDKGICVAAPLEIQVVKDIFLSVYVPYSVVRGEQIELKGSVYNHKASAIKPEGIKKEVHAGFTLDPQGVYGSIKRQQEFRYKVPLNLVPKTQIDRSVSVKGHLMGEVIATVLSPSGLRVLAGLPRGSAEAEFMGIAPLFYVFRYLEESHNWHLLGPRTLTARTEMRRRMKEGNPPIHRFWKDTSRAGEQHKPSSVTAQMVETTAYALLTTLLRGDENYAKPIIKWLSEEQRYGGGFYSTQDTINALEALTEYSLLVKRLHLNMDVKVSYKNNGPLNTFKLTEDNFVGRAMTAPLQDDIYVSTGSSTGIATVNVRTVYNTIGTSEESCNFELKIVPKRDDGHTRREGEPLGRLEACAKYRPSAREPQSGSAHAVMDIGLLASGVDQLIADYEIRDGHVILQVDSVPADRFLCVGFRVGELFRVGMLSPAAFTVYEYHAPVKFKMKPHYFWEVWECVGCPNPQQCRFVSAPSRVGVSAVLNSHFGSLGRLTAFALRILGQVSQYISLDQISICDSLLWLIDDCQMPDGSFSEFSNYQPVKLQGTLPREAKEKALYLTAFSIIGIDRSTKICPTQKIHDAKNKAGDYLARNVQFAQSPFTRAITSYALALVDPDHSSARAAFAELQKEAFVIGNPPIHRFWKDTSRAGEQHKPSSVTAQMVETTAYALLTTLLRGDENYAKPIIKWLSEEQRYGGGFYSTQDTINALEALTEYSLLVKRLHLNMDVKVSYKNNGPLNTFKLTEDNFVGRAMTAPLQDDIYVSTGSSTGIATVNVRTVYNTIGTSEESCNFELKIVPKRDDGHTRREGEPLGRLEACAKYRPSAREPQSGSAHAVMDIGLLASGVDQLIADYEIRDGHVILQVDSVRVPPTPAGPAGPLGSSSVPLELPPCCVCHTGAS
ncbi:hypothetical protein WISP_136761 [Willisornis vidua]|uniref:Anaphylatoxin-like domain-containing protein n=1 Tax=Willisornis vidua TaxID=1566151 RepID=A0ABQ9CTZ6_9PASS|nr:hypothetical protein WISP_136761 [Willisornis vidua]